MTVTNIVLTDPVSGRSMTLMPANGIAAMILDVAATARTSGSVNQTVYGLVGQHGSYDVTKYLTDAAVSLTLALYPDVNNGVSIEHTWDALSQLLDPALRPNLIVTNDQWVNGPRQLTLRFESDTKAFSDPTNWLVQLSFKAPFAVWQDVAVQKFTIPAFQSAPVGLFETGTPGGVISLPPGATMYAASNGGTVTSAASGAPLVLSWTESPLTGQKVLLWVATANTIVSVADNGAVPATWVLDKQVSSSGHTGYLYRADNISMPANFGTQFQVTVTVTGSVVTQGGAVALAGVKAGPPTATNSGTGTSTAVATGNVTPAAAGAFYFAGFLDESALNPETVSAPGSGFISTLLQKTPICSSAAWKTDPAGPTATGTSWTLGDSVSWAALVAVYDAFTPQAIGGLTFAPETAAVDAVISNAGQASWWQANLYGPCSGPSLINDTLGMSLSFPNVTLVAGDYIALDAHQQTAIQASTGMDISGMLNYTGSNWFLLAPGTNLLRYQPTSSGPGSQAVLSYQPCYKA